MDYCDLLGMSEKERDIYYLRTAFLAAKNFSQDANTQTGAVIIDPDFKLISIGANRVNFGDPRRYEGRGERMVFERPEKYELLTHAERDAQYCANRAGRNLVGCTLYTIWVPCRTCAEFTVNNGIKRYVTHQSTMGWYGEAIKDSRQRINWDESIADAIKVLGRSSVEYICLDDKIGGVNFLFDDKIREP
jgi:dCMP deaminase